MNTALTRSLFSSIWALACGSPAPARETHVGQSFATAMGLICCVDQALGLNADAISITSLKTCALADTFRAAPP